MSDLQEYFRPRLVQAWDEHDVGWAAVDDDLYVQWSGQEAGLQIECVSDRFLPEDRRLTFQQRRRLMDDGWQSPGGPELPNYWQRFTSRAQLPLAVAALVGAVDILRSGMPTSEDPKPTLPKPVPTPRPGKRRPGTTTVVVPVGKCTNRPVAWTLAALLAEQPGPVVIDLLGVEDELPSGHERVDLERGRLLPEGRVVVTPAARRPRIGSTDWLRLAADVIDVAASATGAGRDVVVVGPWLLNGDRWLYEGVIRRLADHLVLCVEHDHGDGLVQELAAPFLHKEWPGRSVLVLSQELRAAALSAGVDAVVPAPGGEGDPGAPAVLSALLDGAASVKPALQHLVAEALVAPLWGRFRGLMDAPMAPPASQEEQSLALLDRCVQALVAGAYGAPELVRHVLLGLLDRIEWWVTSDDGATAVLAAADRLALLGPECHGAAARLRQLYPVIGTPSGQAVDDGRGAKGKHHAATGEDLEVEMHYVPAGTVVTSKERFAEVLRRWLDHAEREAVIGQPSAYSGKPLIHVHLGTQRFTLNGDSRDTGIKEYLAHAKQHASAPQWHVVASRSGKVNKVAFGTSPAPIRYFYLYADDEASAPYTG